MKYLSPALVTSQWPQIVLAGVNFPADSGRHLDRYFMPCTILRIYIEGDEAIWPVPEWPAPGPKGASDAKLLVIGCAQAGEP
jgi:hypothetical protein